MTAADFPAFYREVHGHEPFPWQTRLATVLCDNRWPLGVHVPTGCGKTSALDAFVFALACRQGRDFPRRLFYVIDRRVVVDDILAHARTFAGAIRAAHATPAGKPVSAEVARRLAALSLGGEPLVACGMRGGARLEVDWAYAPDQPALIISTIDQTGSRLLFRGYGAAPSAWPIHAGLVGCDSALVLDEAHLSRPFAETLGWLPRAARAEQSIAQVPRVLHLTATPEKNSAEIIELERDDLALDEIQKRTQRPKFASLNEVAAAQFTGTAAREASVFLQRDGVRVVAVIVNRVALAREIFESLRRQGGFDAFLLTGRIRPLDRDRLLSQLLPRCHSKRDRNVSAAPTIVVATQTIEVGADLDFDALVTQSAPLPSLRQRFGRLNRLGLRDSAEAVILHREPDKTWGDDAKQDPVYGADLSAHWDWLSKAEKQLPKPPRAKSGQSASPPPRLNFAASPWSKFSKQLGGEPPVAPRHAPVFLQAHAKLLAHTSPTPDPDVNVQPWLHGVEAGPPDVFVCWRADLSEPNRDLWPDIVNELPPRRGELMALSFGSFRRWLAEQRFDPAAADAEGVSSRADRLELRTRVLRWDAEDSEVVEARQIRPGDTVVLPAAFGGTDEFGFNPAAKPALDLAEAALAETLQARGGSEFVCRLHQEIVPPDWLKDALARYEADEELSADELAPVLASAFDAQRSDLLKQVFADFAVRLPKVEVVPYPAGLLVSFKTPVLRRGATRDADADEATAPRAPRDVVTIEAHSGRVATRAREYAQRCGLPAALQRALELAGLSHDFGKVAPHFQRQMRGGAAELEPGKLLAKMLPGVRFTRPEFPGWRHEALSAALLNGLDAAAFPGVDLELVRYLAGVSHGRGRPFFLPAKEPATANVAATLAGQTLRADVRHGLGALGSGWVELWHRLAARYGWWGLAWLEAILRLADHRVSEEEAS